MSTPRLADVLERNVARFLVGRDREIESFRGLLCEERWPVHLVYVHGPAGVGKTTLLEAFERLARLNDVHVVRFSMDEEVSSPGTVSAALEEAVRRASPEGFWSLISDVLDRWVLLIDNYQNLALVDSWMREGLLPRLPSSCLIVLGSRSPPDPAWRSDLGWGNTLRTMKLESLSNEATMEYLSRRGLDAVQNSRIHALTGGHPLALTLAADMALTREGEDVDITWDSPTITALSNNLIPTCTQAQRTALELTCILRVTNLECLEVLLGEASGDVFGWLARQDLLQVQRSGIRPSHLMRALVEADMSFRCPVHLAKIRGVAEKGCKKHLLHGPTPNGLLDWAYLQRDHPLFAQVWALSGIQEVAVEPARPDDLPFMNSLASESGGNIAAELVRRYLFCPNSATMVCRVGDTPCGFLQTMVVSPGSEQREACPAVAAAGKAATSRGAPVLLARALMAVDGLEASSAARTALALHLLQRALHHGSAAMLMVVAHDLELWASHFTAVDSLRAESPRVSCDEAVGLLVYDLDHTPLMQHFGLAPTSNDLAPSALSALDMGPTAASEAIRHALKSFHDVGALQCNPLIETNFVATLCRGAAGPIERVEALRHALLDAMQELAANPRRAKHARALKYTYMEPLGSQERVAEELDLPMSTFRRYLRIAVDAVIASTWSRMRSAELEPLPRDS